MMPAFENPPDAVVSDEPLYAHYLPQTGLDHPGRDEVIAAQETDWRKVSAALTGAMPGDRRIWYQKHMSHHLLPEVGRPARDVLEDQRRMLGLLCAAVGIAFSEWMLSWPGGPRPTDGVWATYWYGGIWRSTGFSPVPAAGCAASRSAPAAR
jgi:hypothetical protein